MKNNTVKTLILSLGTGSYKEKDTRDRIEEALGKSDDVERKEMLKKIYNSNECIYRTANYSLELNGIDETKEKRSTEFVADVLVEQEKPDVVLIIGTVRSAWSSFYDKFAEGGKKDSQEHFERWERLLRIEHEYGKDTSEKELKKLASEIEELYAAGNVFPSMDSFPGGGTFHRVRVLLVKYGVNAEELRTNYALISNSVENLLETSEKKAREVRKLSEEAKLKFQVSFDITHSFRSLPVYDLVVLNYVKHVTKHKLEICHVYYGNLEISRENGDVAPIVDLGDLVGVMELTNGVTEFKNTGNAVTLLEQLTEQESEIALKKALEEFDWATQTNDFSKIVSSLQKLKDVVQISDRTQSQYADLRKMIDGVLTSKFIKSDDFEMLQNIEDNPENLAKIQYAIANWYKSQNRYGQAVATGLEALRSFLVIFYMEEKNKTDAVAIELCVDEANRKAAIARLHQFVESKKIRDLSIDDNTQILIQLAELESEVKVVRNRFAHNLMSLYGSIKENREDGKTGERDRQVIEEFFDCLEKFKGKVDQNREKMKEAYLQNLSGHTAPVFASNKKNTIRLFISNQYQKKGNYKKYGSSIKRSYEIYHVSEKIRKEILEHTEKGKVIADAFWLCQLINKSFDMSGVVIVLEKINYYQSVYYPAIFNYYGVNVQFMENIGVSIGKIDLNLDFDGYEKRAEQKVKAMVIQAEKEGIKEDVFYKSLFRQIYVPEIGTPENVCVN